MKAIKPILVLLMAAAAASAADPVLGRLPDGTFYVLDEVDFALKPEPAEKHSPVGATRRPVDKGPMMRLHPAVRDIVGGHTAAERWLNGRALPARIEQAGPEVPMIARSLKARLLRGEDAAKVAEELRQHPDVEWASLNLVYAPSLVPNDPQWAYQWGPERVRADEAWEVPQVSLTLRIAVIDTGVDLTHPDLRARIVYDRGFGAGNANGDAKRDMRGGNSIDHGTHVAGIAAAIRGNGLGIAGIATARIMAMGCAVWDATRAQYGICCSADAMNDAVANGADVINCSFTNPSLSFSMGNALNNARSSGVVVVCAAGNDGTNVAESACAGWDEHSWPLIVSNTQRDDGLNGTSNYGSAIDLAAPGTGIFSTVTTNYNRNYGSMSGTSMAAPCVAGGAALLRAMNPDLLAASAVKPLLARMAEDLGSPGHDDSYGAGMLQLDPVYLRILRNARAFVGVSAVPIVRGDYTHPYPAILQAASINPGGTLVLNAGLTLAEYHYPAQTIRIPVTLTALPDAPAIIGR